jgi:lycopene beta-cyclase
VAGGPPGTVAGPGPPAAPQGGGAVFGRATYLVLMAACLLVTLPLELVLEAGVYRRPRRWLAAVVPVFLVFSFWDWVAIRRGHWTYNPRYTTGIELLGLPLEELVFFVVVPTCALLTYQAVVRLLPTPRRREPSR